MGVNREAGGVGGLLFQRGVWGKLARSVWACGAHGGALVGRLGRWIG
jgi:hypothetical protein